jgi:hypothetical protein
MYEPYEYVPPSTPEEVEEESRFFAGIGKSSNKSNGLSEAELAGQKARKESGKKDQIRHREIERLIQENLDKAFKDLSKGGSK